MANESSKHSNDGSPITAAATVAAGTPVPTTNIAAQDASNILQELVGDGLQAAEAAIIADAPIMGAPVWVTLWEAVLSWAVNFVARPLITLSGDVILDGEAWLKIQAALTAQANLDAAKKTGDPHAIAQADQAVDAAVAPVLQYVGSFSPTGS